MLEVPLADGGEGTLDTLLRSQGGSRRVAPVTGPLGERVDAEWGVLPSGVAVIEMARASGLALVSGTERSIAREHAGNRRAHRRRASRGISRRILVAVGGSATTDGGLAAVEALGWSLHGIEVTVACDVESAFLDAARIYGPQKGASDAQVALLTRRLKLVADQYRTRMGVDVTTRSSVAVRRVVCGWSGCDRRASFPVSERSPNRSVSTRRSKARRSS